MRRWSSHIILCVCFLCTGALSAQIRGDALLDIVPTNEGVIIVRFEMGDVAIVDLPDGTSRIECTGMANMATEEGLPALPSLSRMIVLPKGATIGIASKTSNDLRTLRTFKPISPYIANVKDRNIETFKVDKYSYSNDSWFSGNDALILEHLGTMGNREIYRLNVRPVTYNPVSGELAINGHIECELRIDYGTIWNDTPWSVARHYFVVSPAAYRDDLQPFVRWKMLEGYDVEEIYTNNPSCDSVRALIMSRWGKECPEYVLLVGDTAQIRPFVGTSRPAGLPTHATDLYYVERTGDYLPDALIGRWPVRDTSELRTVVQKTIEYIRGTSVDTTVLHRVMLVAGYEQTPPAPTTTNGQVNYLKSEIKSVHSEVDTLCYYNPASRDERSNILADISSGAAMLNYTAHCTANGWTRPAVDYAAMDSAGLTHPMLFVNNCCLSNNFNEDCLGERLLRKDGGGAIGVIGATNSTLWDEDYFWAVGPKYPFMVEPTFDSMRAGAFDRWVGRVADVETQGELLAAGNLAVSAYGSIFDHFYWETYCLLGDPSLRPYLGNVEQAWIALEDSLVAGSSMLSLTATPGSMVTAVEGGLLLGSAVADSTGTVTMMLRESIDTGQVTLTATGRGLLAYEHNTTALRPEHGAAIVGLTINDSTLSFTMANIGTDILRDLTLSISGDSLCATCTQIIALPLTIDSLAIDERVDVEINYSIESIGQGPYWKGILRVADSNELCSIGVKHRMAITYPTLHIDLLNSDSSTADTIGLGGNYIVSAEVDGLYDTVIVSTEEISDSIGHLRISTELEWGEWRDSSVWYVVCGQASDGFENGKDCYPWQDGGATGWELDTSQSHSGHFSVRSGHITHRQKTELRLEILLPHNDSISYWYKTSSEAQADRLYFLVDGVSLANHWGDGNWRHDAFALNAGRHTLCWRYAKDASMSQYGDCVWIDDVRLPLALWGAPYGCLVADSAETPDTNGIVTATKPKISIHPNPANDFVFVETDGLQLKELKLCDLFGRTVATAKLGEKIIDVRLLPTGIYIVCCRMTDGEMVYGKMLIHKR